MNWVKGMIRVLDRLGTDDIWGNHWFIEFKCLYTFKIHDFLWNF